MEAGCLFLFFVRNSLCTVVQEASTSWYHSNYPVIITQAGSGVHGRAWSGGHGLASVEEKTSKFSSPRAARAEKEKKTP